MPLINQTFWYLCGAKYKGVKMKTFGDLSGVYTPPARGGAPSSLIVILHGWGADAADLADLAYPMSLRFPGAAFFIPNAPEPCSMNPMGRQWFDIEDRHNGPVVASDIVTSSLAAAASELGLSMDRVALTGFSQGGMMSLHCGLHMKMPPAAVVSFSGALLRQDLLDETLTQKPAIMLVHGTDDQVVPFQLMEDAASALMARDLEPACVSRPGLGHGIDPDGLTQAIDFLERHLPG